MKDVFLGVVSVPVAAALTPIVAVANPDDGVKKMWRGVSERFTLWHNAWYRRRSYIDPDGHVHRRR